MKRDRLVMDECLTLTMKNIIIYLIVFAHICVQTTASVNTVKIGNELINCQKQNWYSSILILLNYKGAIIKNDTSTMLTILMLSSSIKLINENPYILPDVKLELDIQHYSSINCFQSNKKGEQID